MYNSQFRRDCLRLPTIQLAIAGLLGMALPTAPALAASQGYRTCATDLLGAGIAPETAAAACASVIRPQELGTCVTRINRQTNIAALDALATCSQVRRPIELATCVIDIRLRASETTIPNVLDSCRRSLLPARFSECVVALNNQLNLPTIRAISTCLDARDFAPGLSPLLLPIPQPDAPLPSEVPGTPPVVVPTIPAQ